jgi:hypothetical protein
MSHEAKSLNSPILVKKLSIVITCSFPSMSFDNSIITLCANLDSSLAIGPTIDGAFFLPQ